MRRRNKKTTGRLPAHTPAITARHLLLPSACLLLSLSAPAATADQHQVAGWVEHVLLYPGPIRIKAKLDTGAKTTSLSVINIKQFSHGGRPWVRFRVYDSAGHPVTLERPLVRTVLIKRHGEPAKPRPVVMMKLCLGTLLKATQVDLENRSNYLYPLLVGRRFLAGDFLVDPGRTLTIRPACTDPRN